MRKPHLDAFTTNTSQRQPDNIDMVGIVPLQPKPNPPIQTGTVYKAEEQNSADTTIPSNHDTVIPRHHDTINLIRKELKKIGKEPATHRFTVEEKQMVRRLVRDFEDRGIRTAENEIARIGIHFLCDDYHRHGENSLVVEILKALHE